MAKYGCVGTVPMYLNVYNQSICHYLYATIYKEQYIRSWGPVHLYVKEAATRAFSLYIFYVNKTASVYHSMAGLHRQLKALAHNNAIKLCLCPYKRILYYYM